MQSTAEESNALQMLLADSHHIKTTTVACVGCRSPCTHADARRRGCSRTSAWTLPGTGSRRHQRILATSRPRFNGRRAAIAMDQGRRGTPVPLTQLKTQADATQRKVQTLGGTVEILGVAESVRTGRVRSYCLIWRRRHRSPI